MNHLRQQIDQIDEQLKQLLKQRARLVFAIQGFKAEHQMPPRDSQREKEILDKISLGLSEDEARYLTKVYEAIFRAIE